MSNSNGNAIHLYERLAGEMLGQIQAGVFRPGERLPSVRRVSLQKRLSVTTVLQAYRVLEDRGAIEARPQSGYYVRLQSLPPLSLRAPRAAQQVKPESVCLQDLAQRVLEDASQAGMIHLGAAVPAPDLLPGARLNSLLARLARTGRVAPHLLGSTQGSPELRIQIARRAFLAGCTLKPEEIVVTNGCTEALYLALRAVCAPGDLVAIESPTFFGILQALEAQGLQALEIPTHPEKGMNLEALQSALDNYDVSAVVVISNFSNPLGCSMPDENKRRLVQLLNLRQVPLIEDDIYGELSFLDRRPMVARAFNTQGGVMLCSSFSKCLSPGYRVGWIAPGRWFEPVMRMKAALNMFSSELPQLAVAAFLEGEGFDRCLRQMRRTYARRAAQMGDYILQFFPQGSRVSRPQGGYVLWVELPESVDSLELYRRALPLGITLAPGYLFASTPVYRNYIRLNAALMSPQTGWAVQRLGSLASELLS